MKIYLDIDNSRIPVRIFEERRRSVRASLGQNYVILRVPVMPFIQTNTEKHLEWVKQWLIKLKKEKPHALDRYIIRKEYQNGQKITIGKYQFLLNISTAHRQSGTIMLAKNNVLKMVLPESKDYDKQELIKTLIIKFSQQFFLPIITEKVNYYNNKYFKKEINRIHLKYNKSNWGSCSTGKNLNFSVRLFFAPDDVIDYVVIHELSHLIEMNHSERFWKLVSDIMPDYKEKEEDLKINNARYDF